MPDTTKVSNSPEAKQKPPTNGGGAPSEGFVASPAVITPEALSSMKVPMKHITKLQEIIEILTKKGVISTLCRIEPASLFAHLTVLKGRYSSLWGAHSVYDDLLNRGAGRYAEKFGQLSLLCALEEAKSISMGDCLKDMNVEQSMFLKNYIGMARLGVSLINKGELNSFEKGGFFGLRDIHTDVMLEKKVGAQLYSLLSKSEAHLRANWSSDNLRESEGAEPHPAPDYDVCVTEETKAKINAYFNSIIEEASTAISEDVLEKINGSMTEHFKERLQLIFQLKLPKSFAESAYFNAGKVVDSSPTSRSLINLSKPGEWSVEEYDILEGVIVHMDALAYNDGKWHKPNKNYPVPMDISLWFVPGPVLQEGAGSVELAAFKRCTIGASREERQFNATGFQEEMKQRLFPVLDAINKKFSGSPGVLVTIPGISCGAFGGQWSQARHGFLTQKGLHDALHDILTEHTFEHIGAIVFDAFMHDSLKSCGVTEGFTETSINKTNFICMESMVSSSKVQSPNMLSQPEVWGEQYKGFKRATIVAADALSYPGNDINIGSYNTNEGVVFGCTNGPLNLLGVNVVEYQSETTPARFYKPVLGGEVYNVDTLVREMKFLLKLPRVCELQSYLNPEKDSVAGASSSLFGRPGEGGGAVAQSSLRNSSPREDSTAASEGVEDPEAAMRLYSEWQKAILLGERSELQTRLIHEYPKFYRELQSAQDGMNVRSAWIPKSEGPSDHGEVSPPSRKDSCSIM